MCCRILPAEFPFTGGPHFLQAECGIDTHLVSTFCRQVFPLNVSSDQARLSVPVCPPRVFLRAIIQHFGSGVSIRSCLPPFERRSQERNIKLLSQQPKLMLSYVEKMKSATSLQFQTDNVRRPGAGTRKRTPSKCLSTTDSGEAGRLWLSLSPKFPYTLLRTSSQVPRDVISWRGDTGRLSGLCTCPRT